MSSFSSRQMGGYVGNGDVPSQLSTAQRVGIYSVIYLLAWGGLALSARALYWDDWTLDAGPAKITEIYRQYGAPWIAYLQNALWPLGPAAPHAIAWVCYWFIGIAVMAIVLRLPTIDSTQATFLGCFVAVAPLNEVRHAIIVMPNALFVTAFFGAWWLILKDRRFPYEIVAASLFAISFAWSSLVPFFLLPMTHLWWARGNKTASSIGPFLRRFWFLLVLPIAISAAKATWFSPSGMYEGYNTITVKALGGALVGLILGSIPGLLLFLSWSRLRRAWRMALTPLAGGIFMTALAMFPYVAAHHFPPHFGWNTRHEILMPLGAAFVALGLLRALGFMTSVKVARIAAVGIVVVFALNSVSICLDYWRDARKQASILTALPSLPELKEADVVVVQDDAVDLSLYSWAYAYYAWTAMARRSLGETDVFVVNAGQDFEKFRAGELVGQPPYSADDTFLLLRITAKQEGARNIFSAPQLEFATEQLAVPVN